MSNPNNEGTEDSSKARRVRRLDPTKKTVPDVFYYNPPSNTAKAKQRQPQLVKPILFTGAELDALADGLAKHTLEPTNPLAIKQSSILEKKVNLKAFTCFRELPTELRLKIWKHARLGPRIVRLIWSKEEAKWVDGFFGQKYLPRYNYSPTPIPGILQACAESRQVALEWYQLTLAPAYKEPRTYFDLSADYLYIACENCKTHCCNDCRGILSYNCQHEVQKVLFPWPGQYIDPFHSLFMSYRRIKEVLIFDPDTLSVKPETQLVHLKETTKPFDWQKGKDLHAMFLEMKDRLNSRREQWPEGEWCFKHFRLVNEHIFHIEKITRVELAVTPETSKMYGFMEEELKARDMNFGFN